MGRALDDASLDPVELTVLIPCLDEAETIGTCVTKAAAYLQRSGIRGELGGEVGGDLADRCVHDP